MSAAETLLEIDWGYNGFFDDREVARGLAMVHGLEARGLLSGDRADVWRERWERARLGDHERPAPDPALRERCLERLRSMPADPDMVTVAWGFHDVGLITKADFERANALGNDLDEEDEGPTGWEELRAATNEAQSDGGLTVVWVARFDAGVRLFVRGGITEPGQLQLSDQAGTDYEQAGLMFSRGAGETGFTPAPPGETVVLHDGNRSIELRLP